MFWQRASSVGSLGRAAAAPADDVSIRSDMLPIFLMHVPKCAGTSVSAYLRRWFDVSEICPLPSQGVWKWRAHEVPGFKLYSGHFSADFLHDAGPGTRLIVMRHPLRRVVSLYDFWRSYRWEYIRSSLQSIPDNGPVVAKAGDFAAFLRTDSEFAIEQIYNPVARQLLGRKYLDLWPDEDAIISESLETLRTFDWIGITELFDRSLELLSSMLRVPKPASIPNELSTYSVCLNDRAREPVQKTSPTQEEIQRVLRGNRLDLALYDEACKLVRPGWESGANTGQKIQRGKRL